MSIRALDNWSSASDGPPVISDGAVTLDSWAASDLSAPYFATPKPDYRTLDYWVSSSQSPAYVVSDASDLHYWFDFLVSTQNRRRRVIATMRAR